MVRLLVSPARSSLGRGAALIVVLLAGCNPPERGAAGAPATLYVANGRDGTVTSLDAASGRALGPPRPAGPAPAQIAAGPGGRLLVLSARGTAVLTHVAPTAPAGGRDRGDGGWAARPVPLEAHATTVLLAGDGRGHAALAYRVALPAAPPAAWPCRLVLLEVATGAVVASHAPCGAGEAVVSLALDRGPAGPMAYLGLWRAPEEDDAQAGSGPTGGRLRAVDASTGAVVAAAPLAGVPEQLVLALAPGGTGRALYVVEGRHSGGRAPGDAARADHWVVQGLDPSTLAPGWAVALPGPPRGLAVGADGQEGYALVGPGGPASPGQLVRLDLRRGAARFLGSVPVSGHAGLAVAGDRLYVPDPMGDVVVVLDRRSGAPLRPAAAGRGPIGIAVAGR